MALAESERSSSLTGSPARAVWQSKGHANSLERYFCGKHTCGGKGCGACLGTAELVQRAAIPTLNGVVLRPADAPVGVRVTGSGRSRSVLLGEPAMWTGAPKRRGLRPC